jgi:hypothetical protein
MRRLTAAGVRNRRSAARAKLPAETHASNTRRDSRDGRMISFSSDDDKQCAF